MQWRRWRGPDGKVYDQLAQLVHDLKCVNPAARVHVSATRQEPTTFLDIAHQIEVLDLCDGLRSERGYTMVAVLHDLNLACRYATHLVAMKDGAIVAQGPPDEVITPPLVEHVFGLPARVIEDPETRTPLVIPLSNGRRTPPAADPDVSMIVSTASKEENR